MESKMTDHMELLAVERRYRVLWGAITDPDTPDKDKEGIIYELGVAEKAFSSELVFRDFCRTLRPKMSSHPSWPTTNDLSPRLPVTPAEFKKAIDIDILKNRAPDLDVYGEPKNVINSKWDTPEEGPVTKGFKAAMDANNPTKTKHVWVKRQNCYHCAHLFIGGRGTVPIETEIVWVKCPQCGRSIELAVHKDEPE